MNLWNDRLWFRLWNSVCFRVYCASIVHSDFQEFSTFQKFAIYFYFIIIEPRTTILGNKELFIEAGSTINLTCIIQAGSMRDTHIFWNYDGKVSVSRFDHLLSLCLWYFDSCQPLGCVILPKVLGHIDYPLIHGFWPFWSRSLERYRVSNPNLNFSCT